MVEHVRPSNILAAAHDAESVESNNTFNMNLPHFYDDASLLSPLAPHLYTPVYYLILLFMVILIVVAVAANLCNLYVILKTPQLRHNLSNFFVVSLCVADLLAALCVMPVAATAYATGTEIS